MIAATPARLSPHPANPLLRSSGAAWRWTAALSVLLVPWLFAANITAASPEPAGRVEIHLQPEPAGRPAAPAVLLTVENRGETPVVMIRPRHRMLDLYGYWGGWTLTVTGPKGAMEPLPLPGAVVPVTPADCIELKAGESFGVSIALESWIPSDTKSGESLARLADTPGKYTLHATYSTLEHPFPGQEAADIHLTPFVGLRSAALPLLIPASR
jgi:hypothetical protein